MKSNQSFKFPAKAKTALYLLTATATGLTFHFHAANHLNFQDYLPDKIRAAIHASLRSSRAISTVRPILFNSLTSSLSILSLFQLIFHICNFHGTRLLLQLLTTSTHCVTCLRTPTIIAANYLRYF